MRFVRVRHVGATGIPLEPARVRLALVILLLINRFPHSHVECCDAGVLRRSVGNYDHRPCHRMILPDRARSPVPWCDGEQSKIRMQEPRAKNSGTKIGKSGSRGRNRGLTREAEAGKVVGSVDAICPSAALRLRAAGFAAARPERRARRHALRRGARRSYPTAHRQ